MFDSQSEGELLAVPPDLLPGDCLEDEIFSADAVISRYKIFIFILHCCKSVNHGIHSVLL